MLDSAWRRVPALASGARTRRVVISLFALALLMRLAPSGRADRAPRGDEDCPEHQPGARGDSAVASSPNG